MGVEEQHVLEDVGVYEAIALADLLTEETDGVLLVPKGPRQQRRL